MGVYATSPNLLVADVDCTGGGSSLCQEHDIQSFPQIKFGDPASPTSLQNYIGDRSLQDLKKHAEKIGGTFAPLCSPAIMDSCSDKQKKQISDFRAMSFEE